MPNGEVIFRKVQVGLQSAFGTPVAATRMWPSTVKMPQDRNIKFPQDALGVRARSNRSVVHQILTDGLPFNLDEPCFQDLPFLFSIGLVGSVTPAEQTTDQDDYLWDFTPDLADDNTPKPGTAQFGNDIQVYQIGDVFARKYTIGGKLGGDEAVKISCETFGGEITPISAFTVLSPIVGEPMSANLTNFFIDSAFADLGDTKVTDLIHEYSIEILTGIYPRFEAKGVKTPTSFGESYIDMMMTLTMRGSSVADGLWDDMRAETPRAIRCQILGSKIGTGENHTLNLGCYGKFEKVIPMDGDQDGDDLTTAIFHNLLDGSSSVEISLITDINAV